MLKEIMGSITILDNHGTNVIVSATTDATLLTIVGENDSWSVELDEDAVDVLMQKLVKARRA